MKTILTWLTLMTIFVIMTLCAQAQSLVVNGNKVTAATVVKNGSSYVEAAPFVHALGGELSWDAGTRKLTIVVGASKVIVSPQVINGKSYISAAEVAKALGASISYDTKSKVLTVMLSASMPAVKGTTQLAGDNAVLGQAFTLNDSHPINFSLRSLEYSVGGMRCGDTTLYPMAEEKFLILHYTLQNPNPHEYGVNWNTLRFTAVDAENMNHEFTEYVAEEKTGAKVSMSLKPGQKIECYTAIRVPASKAIPKLMVLPPDGKVLRYNLTLDANKVKGLEAPYADPKDPTGAVAPVEVPVEMGKPYLSGTLLYTLKSAEYSIAGCRFGAAVCYPKQDEKVVVLHFTVKNPNLEDCSLNWASIRHAAYDEKGTVYKDHEYIGSEDTNDTVSMQLKPAQSIEAYTCIVLPADRPVQQLKVMAEEYRTLCYDFSNPVNTVKRLEAPYADPEDASGATALTDVPAELKTPYVTGSLQVALTNAEYIKANFGDVELPEDGSLLLLTYTVKNLHCEDINIDWTILTPVLLLDDDSEAEWTEYVYSAKSPRTFSGEIKPGKEVSFRHCFYIPAETSAGQLSLREGNEETGGRTLVFDLSGVTQP